MTEAALLPTREEVRDGWLRKQDLDAPVTSNLGAGNLPFQRWFRFKEAFSPAFVTESVESCNYPVRCVLDPFGGSGTTAVTARMAGIDSVSIEVNPFLADVIRAKVTPVPVALFEESSKRIVSGTRVVKGDYEAIVDAPATLVEPGVKGRYVYGREAYAALRALNRRITQLERADSRLARLARVLLGGILVVCSNVTINGKGRRYRRNWEARQITKVDVFDSFEAAVGRAAEDLRSFNGHGSSEHRVYTDDARSRLEEMRSVDLAVFSPPYPNSFDYTDVYNLELWMLGYFRQTDDNRRHRARTLRSHVQIKWPDAQVASPTPKLEGVMDALEVRRGELWNKNIPEMVAGYFVDLENVLRGLNRVVREGGCVVVAVGDSQYGGVRIDTAGILTEIAERNGYAIEKTSEIRSMRSSAQHGGGSTFQRRRYD